MVLLSQLLNYSEDLVRVCLCGLLVRSAPCASTLRGGRVLNAIHLPGSLLPKVFHPLDELHIALQTAGEERLHGPSAASVSMRVVHNMVCGGLGA